MMRKRTQRTGLHTPRQASPGKDKKARDKAEFELLEDVMGGMRSDLVQVSDDGLQAVIRVLQPGVKYNTVVAALQGLGVQFGIDEPAIRRAVGQAARDGRSQKNVVVASGVPPTVEVEGRIQYHVPVFPLGTDGKPASEFEAFKLLLEKGKRQELEDVETAVKAVGPGHTLVTVVRTRGKPGRDMYDNEISLDSGEAALPRPGKNVEVVEVSENEATYVSRIYGYAGVIGKTVQVLPPIWISPDNMEAYFLNLPQLGERCLPTPEDILESLSFFFVEYGIKESGIALACKCAQAENPVRMILIAEGEAEQPGKDAAVELALDTTGITPLYQVFRLLKSRSFEDLEQGKVLSVQAVLPGQVVAGWHPATEGIMGRDVFGEEIPAEPGRDKEFAAEGAAEVSDDGQTCVSKVYGYTGFIDGAVWVLPPIWIAPDNMDVYFLNLPQRGEIVRPNPEDIFQFLESAGVVYGIDETCIAALCEGKLDEELRVRIAEGKRPAPGLDAELTFALDVERKPGEIQEDGSIDFKQLNLTPNVTPDQFVAEKTPVTQGVAGKDVKGLPAQPTHGEDITIFTKQNIRVERDRDNIRLYASKEGGLLVTKSEKAASGRTAYTFLVNPIFQAPLDIDYSTGDVVFLGDIYVRGSVRSGFSLKAGGSIAVGGVVEDKTTLCAEGDVVVSYGIMGKETEVKAGGRVQAKFIQDASVSAGGDVDVGAYLFNGSIRSSGVVRVYGKGKSQTQPSSCLVGGFVWAKKGIRAQSIGSTRTGRTALVAGVDQELFKKLVQAQKGLERVRTYSARLLRAFGLTAFNSAQVKRALLRVRSRQQRASVAVLAKKLCASVKVQGKFEKEEKTLKEEMQHVAVEASIQTPGYIWPGVNIRIGNEQIRTTKRVGSVMFRLAEVDGVWAILQQSI